MNRSCCLIGIGAIFVFGTLANAAPVTFNFGNSPATCYVPSALSGCTTVASLTTMGVGTGGLLFTQSGENVRVYGESGGSVVAGPNTGGPGAFTGGLDLMRVQNGDAAGDNATGIAPYIPSQGVFTNQNGITETSFLVLQLDSSILQGSSIGLLLQAGVTGDAFNIYRLDSASVPTGLGTGGANPMTLLAPSGVAVDETIGGRTPSTPQFSFTKTTSGTEWIAIQADCHYLLLDALTVTPGVVPEPRFYGMLLAGLLGLAGTIYRKRQATA
jgi:hypothetical protein